ncbi:MAG: hypothetical protein DRP70_03225 [Spirochaetes bacterium]|nr:MAG: hypothetical protein DRP70_03225 [Spirochaetota bacterium]RKX98175.1 MAG: hypothetical protein DRZ90_03745 [Spirochaetota bacterium]
MSDKNSSDFRYNTGEVQVPWAAVGENYSPEDILEFVRFLIQGDGAAYETAFEKTREAITTLSGLGSAPGKLSLGDKVQEIERKVDSYLGIKDSTFITNATAGFEIAGKYAGLKEGDEVIVPAITFIATMSYPLSVGAKVIFADVDPYTLNMDPTDVERKISSKTKLIIPVHIGGWPVDMDPIMALAKKHDIVVLEDAAHAFGAVYKGRKIGTIGDFASFSFHEVKNITSFGEGGIVTCTLPFSEELKKARFLGLDMSRAIKNWLYDVTAVKGKYGYFSPGNSSSTEIQALGLLRQFGRIDDIIGERRGNAEFLTKIFSTNPAIIPQKLDSDEIKSTYHLYLLQIDPEKAGGDVQVLKKKMTDRGLTNIPHFAPLYKFEILKQLGYDIESIEASCPVTEEVFNRRFTHLPLYGLSREQLKTMSEIVLASISEMQEGQ